MAVAYFISSRRKLAGERIVALTLSFTGEYREITAKIPVLGGQRSQIRLAPGNISSLFLVWRENGSVRLNPQSYFVLDAWNFLLIRLGST